MYIGIDIGGTNIRVATSKSAEKPKIEEIRKFKRNDNYSLSVEEIISTIKDVSVDNKLEGIGLGIPGILKKEKESLKLAANLKSWNDKPLKTDLKKAFDCRIIIENDAALAALGEAVHGDRSGGDFNFIIWGTGFGGAAVNYIGSDTRVTPFEPGHHIYNWHGQECKCGQKGCAEYFSSAAAIRREFGHPSEDMTDSEWDQLVQKLAHGLFNVIMIRPTKKVVFGGGRAIRRFDKVKQVENIIRDRMIVGEVPEFVPSVFGEDTGLFGAFTVLARNNQDLIY